MVESVIIRKESVNTGWNQYFKGLELVIIRLESRVQGGIRNLKGRVDSVNN